MAQPLPFAALLALAACAASGRLPDTSADSADTAADTADTATDTADTAGDCATEECCYEHDGDVWVCAENAMWGGELLPGVFTTAETRGAQTVWTFHDDAGVDHEVSVTGSGLAVRYLDHLDELGPVWVAVTGGCASDGEAETGGAFWVLDDVGTPLVVVGTGEVDDHGLQVIWDPTAEVCTPRPSDGCSELVVNAPLAATLDGHTVSVWQGAMAALGHASFRVAWAERPRGQDTCDDSYGLAIDWVFGPGI